MEAERACPRHLYNRRTMICSRLFAPDRPHRRGRLLVVALLALGACDFPIQEGGTRGGGGNGSEDEDEGPTLSASVSANTKMTATIIDNFGGGDAHNSLGQGSDLANKTLSVSNGEGDSASASFSLDAESDLVVYRIEDSAVCTGNGKIAAVGKNVTPNNHQTLLTLYTTESVTGLLTVTLDGQASSLAGSGFTTIDVGNDSDPDFQTPNLKDAYVQEVTFDSTFEVRTETVTQVENNNTVSRSITITFMPVDTEDLDGDGGGASVGLERRLAASGGPRAAAGAGTAGSPSRANPPHRGSGVVRRAAQEEAREVARDPARLASDEPHVPVQAGLDCDGDGVLDARQLLLDPALDLDGDGRLDDCEGAFERYCPASVNSSGRSAALRATGSVSLAANDLTLTVSHAPAHQPGLFLYGPERDLTVEGDGFLCVGAPRVHLEPVLLTDATGAASLSLDLVSEPFSGGAHTLAAHETWSFQFWFRDPLGGPEGFNLSDALAVTFRP